MPTIKPMKGETLAVFFKKEGESTYTLVATATEFSYDISVEEGENIMLLTGDTSSASWATPTDGGVSWSGSMNIINTFDESDIAPKILEYINANDIVDFKLAKVSTGAPDTASMHLTGSLKMRGLSGSVAAGSNVTGSVSFAGYGALVIAPATVATAAKQTKGSAPANG